MRRKWPLQPPAGHTGSGDYHWCLPEQGHPIDTARLFQFGRSQAVRLPKEYRFSGTEVVVKHFGNGVLFLPMDDPWQSEQVRVAISP